MATMLNQSFPTLAEAVKRQDPNGSIADIAEVLTQTNPILQDAVWQEGNLPTGHRYTSRTGLPSVAWRKLNEGVSPTKSDTAQIDETCGRLSTMSVLDTEVARLNGNSAAFRASEDVAFLQAMNNEVATGMFYHNVATAPEKFHGLAPRLASTSGSWGKQVISAAGDTTLTSVWLVGWGAQSVFCIYPKGSTGGLESTDMGEQLWDDGNSKKFRAFVTEWNWKIGLVVKDYRYVCRIANIKTSTLNKGGSGSGSGSLIDNMIKAWYQVEQTGAKFVWYANRTIAAWLHLQALGAASYQIKVENVDGKPVLTFLGIPVRVVDAITNSEAAVS